MENKSYIISRIHVEREVDWNVEVGQGEVKWNKAQDNQDKLSSIKVDFHRVRD
jgi:hypothetical protein